MACPITQGGHNQLKIHG